ncbi:hypothetical protein BBOMB_0200 [Bifidobacterium bombi DSM 19703]|uniref:Uncharacterized protein n=1 Tax=Bifidobacterium bombi DSM 19703 TaxID=1341695 RepID=A0A080N1X8_9BIFI|nr:hypothetical protein BBOMB_0200 [Bifidobacterium bombi DSM 19703]
MAISKGCLLGIARMLSMAVNDWKHTSNVVYGCYGNASIVLCLFFDS